ncbi:3057_t:CDS:2 [Ambispora gerdemannii]|uniref:3057_t:CDS:1 n=1 Tax=Ambispora gerdemannii TaxID=144530 RepID=A0A9N8VF57_9GLOM|nr:3057_t:CDS:2 [Ambispora gerdemannii]
MTSPFRKFSFVIFLIIALLVVDSLGEFRVRKKDALKRRGGYETSVSPIIITPCCKNTTVTNTVTKTVSVTPCCKNTTVTKTVTVTPCCKNTTVKSAVHHRQVLNLAAVQVQLTLISIVFTASTLNDHSYAEFTELWLKNSAIYVIKFANDSVCVVLKANKQFGVHAKFQFPIIPSVLKSTWGEIHLAHAEMSKL